MSQHVNGLLHRSAYAIFSLILDTVTTHVESIWIFVFLMLLSVLAKGCKVGQNNIQLTCLPQLF